MLFVGLALTLAVKKTVAKVGIGKHGSGWRVFFVRLLPVCYCPLLFADLRLKNKRYMHSHPHRCGFIWNHATHVKKNKYPTPKQA